LLSNAPREQWTPRTVRQRALTTPKSFAATAWWSSSSGQTTTRKRAASAGREKKDKEGERAASGDGALALVGSGHGRPAGRHGACALRSKRPLCDTLIVALSSARQSSEGGGCPGGRGALKLTALIQIIKESSHRLHAEARAVQRTVPRPSHAEPKAGASWCAEKGSPCSTRRRTSPRFRVRVPSRPTNLSCRSRAVVNLDAGARRPRLHPPHPRALCRHLVRRPPAQQLARVQIAHGPPNTNEEQRRGAETWERSRAVRRGHEHEQGERAALRMPHGSTREGGGGGGEI